MGEVEHIGENVTGFSIGDRVMATPVISCGTCPICVNTPERNHLCFNWKYFGMHINGGYAEYCTVPAKCIVKLPDSITYEEATCFGVAGLTAYHALYTIAKLKAGETFYDLGRFRRFGDCCRATCKSSRGNRNRNRRKRREKTDYP